MNVLRAVPLPAAPEPRGGGVAVATRQATRVVVIRAPHDEFREPFVAIYAGRGGDRRLVTAIEVLSPTNKTPGARGRDLYVRKQQELVYGQAHLVELDLLRAGEHTTAVPQDRLLEAAQPFDYHVCVHRCDALEEFVVYPILLDDPLPTVAIPLLGKDPPVEIDLQAVFTRCYDTGPYRRSLDYADAELDPPLPAERHEWLQGVLGGVTGC